VTQLGRALSSLNIDIVCASTPAAKGRVERAHLTLQDRLVKELRFHGLSDVEAANAVAPEFMADYNRRFARASRSEHDAHRPLQPSGSARQRATVHGTQGGPAYAARARFARSRS
jgi:hypothetical protein